MGSMFNTALWGGGVPAGTVTVSGRSLGTDALRLLGVLRPGSFPAPDSLNDCLRWSNELIDSWATERLMVKVIARSLIAMDGSISYNALPHRIEGAGYTSSGGATEYPLRVYTQEEWRAAAQKILVGEPSGVYPDYIVPELALYPWPQPATGDLAIYQWSPLEALGDLDAVYVLPAGYALALRFCLAVQIAPAFRIIMKIAGVDLDDIKTQAREYKGRIKSLNSTPPPMVFDNPFTGSGRYDILSGRQL